MRQYIFGALCALTSFAIQSDANAEEVVHRKKPRTAAVEFAEHAFKTLQTLPRTDEANSAIPKLLHDEKAWQEFLTRNFTAPNIGFIVIKDMTTTYHFSNIEADVYEDQEVVVVPFEAVQEIRVFDRVAGRNCIVGGMYLDMPKGVDDSEGATVKSVTTVMMPMGDKWCRQD